MPTPGGLSPSVTSKWAKGTGGPSGDECQNLVAIGGSFDTAHSLRADGFDASEDGTGRETPLVAMGFHSRQDPIHASVSMPLEAKGGQAVAQVRWASGGGQVENDTMQALRAGAEHNYQFLRQSMSVRRLTPTECERLQNFPDGYTAIQYKSKPAADGPRYKALGNSMAVCVAEWVLRRIGMMEALSSNPPATRK